MDNIAKLGPQLFGAQTNVADKDKMWADLQKHINNVGGNNRSIEEIKKAWKNLKRQTKKKLDHNKTQKILESKGEKANLLELTSIEKRVEVVLQIKEIDSQDFQEELDEGNKNILKLLYLCFTSHSRNAFN